MKTLHPIVRTLLVQRHGNVKEAEEFISPSLKGLPDFSRLPEIEKASLRIVRAIEKKEVLGAYGDYDVDGTTSCALFYWFLSLFPDPPPCVLLQPSRFVEGYGLHKTSIEEALKKEVGASFNL